jgi:hypothetical protein
MVTTQTAPRFVARHDTGRDSAFMAERLNAEERLFVNAWNHLPNRPGNISSMFRYARKAFGWRAALNPEDPLLHRDLQRVARCGCVMGQLVAPGSGPVAVDVGLSATVEVPRIKTNDILDADKLTNALFAAMICRDRQAIQDLCRVDARGLTMSGTVTDDYAFTFIAFLQGILTNAPGAGAKLVQAINETDPETLKTGNVDYALYIAVGEIDLFHALGVPDPAVFDDKLTTALERHKRFYEKVEVNPGETQRNDPRGFVALGLTAAACLVHDHGRPTAVRSDYLPQSLVEGRFVART